MWAFLAASVIASVARRLESSNYVPTLWPIANSYKSELRRDVWAASGLAAITILVVAVRCRFGLPTAADFGFLAAVICVLGMGIRSQGKTKPALARKLGVEA